MNEKEKELTEAIFLSLLAAKEIRPDSNPLETARLISSYIDMHGKVMSEMVWVRN